MAFSEWCKFNRLKINANKTKYMIFTNKSFTEDLALTIDDEVIERVDSFVYLGVLIDSKLKFTPHIDNIARKLARFCGITYRLGSSLSLSAAKTYYYSFIYSVFTYGILIWGGCLLNSSKLVKIQKYQDKIVKTLFAHFFPNCTLNSIYYQLNILKVKDIYVYSESFIVYVSNA